MTSTGTPASKSMVAIVFDFPRIDHKSGLSPLLFVVITSALCSNNSLTRGSDPAIAAHNKGVSCFNVNYDSTKYKQICFECLHLRCVVVIA